MIDKYYTLLHFIYEYLNIKTKLTFNVLLNSLILIVILIDQ